MIRTMNTAAGSQVEQGDLGLDNGYYQDKDGFLREKDNSFLRDKFSAVYDSQELKTAKVGSSDKKPSLDDMYRDAAPDFGSAERLYEHMQKTGNVMMYGYFYEISQEQMEQMGFEQVYGSLEECLQANPDDQGNRRNGAELVDELSEHDCMIGPDGAIYRVPEQFREGFQSGTGVELKFNDGSRQNYTIDMCIPAPIDNIRLWKAHENSEFREYWQGHTDERHKHIMPPFPDVDLPDAMWHTTYKTQSEPEVHVIHKTRGDAEVHVDHEKQDDSLMSLLDVDDMNMSSDVDEMSF